MDIWKVGKHELIWYNSAIIILHSNIDTGEMYRVSKSLNKQVKASY